MGSEVRSRAPAGGNPADPTRAFPAAEEKRPPPGKQKKRRKKEGFRAFCWRTGKAIKRHFLCCGEDDIACSDPTEDPDLSPLQWPLSVDPGPSGIETANTDPANPEPPPERDPEPSPVPGPSALHSGTPGPSGLGPAVEKQKKRKMKVICELFHRRCRAVKRSVRRFLKGNTVTPDQTDPEPPPVPGPSALHSGTPGPSAVGPAVDPCGFNPMAHWDPADLQPHVSVLSWLSADPGPSYYEWTADPYPDIPELSPVSGPSSLGSDDSQSSSISLDPQSTLDSGQAELVSELSVLGPSSREETSVSSLSSLELTPDMGLADPEPKPVPDALDGSGFCPATGSISSYYDVKREIGRGGFGIVHEGTRRFDGLKVAIKFLPKNSWNKFIELPGSTKPLLAEVAVNLQMRTSPKSPNIVQMLDWFDEPEQYILIMEYPHPCETLLKFAMSKGGFLEETVARGLMRQAVLAAKLCVDRGVYHNDIKTNNILINTETLQLKLIDFGCSDLFKTSKTRELVVESTVWSLGRVLLEIVSGEKPLGVLLSGRLDPLLTQSLSKGKAEDSKAPDLPEHERTHLEALDAKISERKEQIWLCHMIMKDLRVIQRVIADKGLEDEPCGGPDN